MGISVSDFHFWSGVWAEMQLTTNSSVCDIGRQDIDADAASARTAQAIARQISGKEIHAPRTAAEFWRAQGIEYSCLDLFGPDIIRFDLNFDRVPRRLRGRFDLVTNCGTTEHVANQLNAFAAIHDLTRPGGLMYHALPAGGHTHHGFFVYNMRFFMALASANRYDMVDAFFAAVPLSPLDADVRSSLSAPEFNRPRPGGAYLTIDTYKASDAGVRLLLRRPKDDQGFAAPSDFPPDDGQYPQDPRYRPQPPRHWLRRLFDGG